MILNMAITQFKLSVIPRNALIRKLNIIPEKFDVLPKNEWIIGCWKMEGVQAKGIIPQIDLLLPQIHSAATHIGWKIESGTLDNDVWMLIVEETGQIELLDFRANISEQGLAFISEMVSIIRQYNCLLMDRLGNVVEAEMNEVLKLVKISHPLWFENNRTSSRVPK